ncbi:MAG: phytanoyl-CoA dioxygenase family protein [Planctomycetes bacterium]|nr:phytanoyl-CoA dioxygenase family protein [Planctomycetota bacterium]
MTATRTPAAPAAAKRQFRPAEPFGKEETQRIIDDFLRDGYVVIPDILTPTETDALKRGIDFVSDNPYYIDTRNQYGSWITTRLFETDKVFRDLLVREPIIGLAEAILGAQCHLMAQNAVRNVKGESIDTFHVDDADPLPEVPCPEGMERHDPRYRLPVMRMTVQMPLTDLNTLDDGPTQFVRGSHYSGRNPNDKYNPTFEGRGPDTILCKAGDIYLHNGQCWHRGTPIKNDSRRYLLQNAYCRRWVSSRFYPFLNYHIPDYLLEGASERLLRVLGKHPTGPYG